MNISRREWWWGQTGFMFLLALMGLVLVRCGHLQYYKVDEFRQRAERQQLKVLRQEPRRGMIVDRRGRVMAVSTRITSVRLDPVLIEDRAGIAKKLAEILELEYEPLAAELEERKEKRFMWVKRDVSEQEIKSLKELGQRGIVLENEYQRCYPMGQLASHVIGFTTIDGDGLEGIERRYNECLAGKQGSLELCTDVRRRTVGTAGKQQAVEDGQTVVLTIDAVIQATVEKHLQDTVEKFQATAGTAVVMDPSTGDVLALANWPTYEPAQGRQSSLEARRNRALTDPIEPGSTFKPFTVAAALEGGYTRLNEKIDCLQTAYSGKGIGTIREYKHPYGVLSVSDILIHSSNVGVAKLSQWMGKEYFYGMIEKFGFGQKTGIDLSGEGSGILRPLKEWCWGDYALTRASFGQGPVVVTPMQLIRSFCCLANGGWRLRPRAVRGILSAQGEVLEDFTSVDDAVQILSPKTTWSMIDDPLCGVVERKGGSANKASLEKYKVFGKTGTAQIPRKDGPGYEYGKWVSSFIGGAPSRRPRVVVLMSIREPDRALGLGYTGGQVAAPAVGAIIQETLEYLGVPAEIENEIACN